MGQKVNPVGFRVLKNKKWNSVWFDKKNYAKNLINDIKIANFIEKNYLNFDIFITQVAGSIAGVCDLITDKWKK